MSYSIDLNQFFPLRTNETTSNRTQIVTDSLAVLGQLPASSLLHYALNHLATVDETGHVLILTSNRLALKESLLELKDDSFSASLTPDLIAALDRIEIKYLPTSSHFRYFLYTVYTYNVDRSEEATREIYEAYQTESVSSTKTVVDPSYLPVPPTLVISHNLSDYLTEPYNQTAGIDAYTSLVAQFTTTFASLTTPPPLVLLLDRSALSSRLPVIAPHLHKLKSSRKRSLEDRAEVAAEEYETLGLDHSLDLFFQHVGRVKVLPIEVETKSRRFRLTVSTSSRNFTTTEVSSTSLVFYTEDAFLPSLDDGVDGGTNMVENGTTLGVVK